jgi:lysophospholipase L1-like esterase
MKWRKHKLVAIMLFFVSVGVDAGQRFSAPIIVGDSWSNNELDWPAYTESILYSEYYNHARSGQWLSAGSPFASITTNIAGHLDLHPDADSIIVQGGVNDFNNGVTSPTVQLALVDIIATIRSHDNIRDIIVMGPGPYRGYYNWQASEQVELESYLAWLPAFCAAEGLHYYDTYAAAGDPSNPEYILAEYDLDGLHVNAAGAAAIASGIDSIVIQIRNDNTIAVEMRVMPWRSTAEVKPTSNDPIAVAVYSAGIANTEFEEFDATQIDPETLRLGFGAAPNIAAPYFNDLDGDQLSDAGFIFNTQDTGVLCGDTEVTLEGETYTGEYFTGIADIVTVDCDGQQCHP